MKFAALSPLTLVGALMVTAAIVIGLHLLRRTPRSQIVSNVEFWRRAAARSRPRTLISTRIPWLPLLLALVIGVFFVGEMGDPRIGTGFSGTTVIVLDADRTMGVRDGHGRRRFDDALSLASETVQADTVSGQIAIVRAGVHPEVLVPLTHRASDAERGLHRIETDDGTADLQAAIVVARGIVHGAGGAGRVLVLSDRDPGAVAEDRAVPVTLRAVGDPAETIAITAFDARRDPGALGEYNVRCEIRSYAAHAARMRLVIRDRETVISEQPLQLAPGESTTHRAHGFSSSEGELSATLEHITLDGGQDALESDDRAYASVPPVVATRVLLVTAGNRYLRNALAANPAVELDTIAPGELASRRASLSRYQVVVLDRVAPEPALEHPAQLIFGASNSAAMRVGPEMQSPLITAFAADHRVLSGLRFDQVQIARAHALVPDHDDRVLVRSGRDVLAVARDRDGRRMVALGFETDDTDLVQRIAFPLFMHNALVWLDRRERAFHSWQSPGEPIRAPGAHGVVLTPSGEGREARGALYETELAGMYHTNDRAVAVSAADESGAIATTPGHGGSTHGARRGRTALSLMVASAIVLLLLAEWLLAQRGRLQ